MERRAFVYRVQKQYLTLWERIKIFFKGDCVDIDIEVFKRGEEFKFSSTHFAKTFFFSPIVSYTKDSLPESLVFGPNKKPLCVSNTIRFKDFHVTKEKLSFFERIKILFKKDPLIKIKVHLGKNWYDHLYGYAEVPLSRILSRYCREALDEDHIFENENYWTKHRIKNKFSFDNQEIFFNEMGFDVADFIPLHLYSINLIHNDELFIEMLVKKAKELKMPALALTDFGKMYNIPPFVKLCRENKIKPIIGQAFFIADSSRLVLLCENEIGYKNLLQLSNLAQYYKNTKIKMVNFELLKQYYEGLICLSGGFEGEIAELLLRGDEKAAIKIAEEYKSLFGNTNFYIEIPDHRTEGKEALADKLEDLALDLGIPFVATSKNSLLLTKEELKKKWFEHEGMSDNIFNAAIKNTERIAYMCNFEEYFFEQVLPSTCNEVD